MTLIESIGGPKKNRLGACSKSIDMNWHIQRLIKITIYFLALAAFLGEAFFLGAAFLAGFLALFLAAFLGVLAFLAVFLAVFLAGFFLAAVFLAGFFLTTFFLGFSSLPNLKDPLIWIRTFFSTKDLIPFLMKGLSLAMSTLL